MFSNAHAQETTKTRETLCIVLRLVYGFFRLSFSEPNTESAQKKVKEVDDKTKRNHAKGVIENRDVRRGGG